MMMGRSTITTEKASTASIDRRVERHALTCHSFVSPDGLIWADRLNEAAKRAHADPDINSRRTTLILLSQLRRIRGQPEIALHLAEVAVRIDGDDENACIVKGHAELERGDVPAARESLRQALRINSASSGVTALQATIEHYNGDENARFTLDRAITLGAILRPPG